jgi:hypothetical protein
MTREQLIHEIRRLRYAKGRRIPLAVLAKLAGVARQSLYDIAEKGTISLDIASKVGKALETVQRSPGQVAPSKRRTPVLEPRR